MYHAVVIFWFLPLSSHLWWWVFSTFIKVSRKEVGKFAQFTFCWLSYKVQTAFHLEVQNYEKYESNSYKLKCCMEKYVWLFKIDRLFQHWPLSLGHPWLTFSDFHSDNLLQWENVSYCIPKLMLQVFFVARSLPFRFFFINIAWVDFTFRDPSMSSVGLSRNNQ